MKAIRAIALLAVIAAAFSGGYVYRAIKGGTAQPSNKGERKILYWVDPMHPAYKSDKPGIAPDCGMKLEPVYADGGGPSPPVAGERKVLYYRDPKDPNYKAQQPGLNPETGNELEPVYGDDISAMPVGTVQITPEKQQLIGVKYGEVERTGGSRTIRAVGKVAVPGRFVPSGKWRSTRHEFIMSTPRWKGGSIRFSSITPANSSKPVSP